MTDAGYSQSVAGDVAFHMTDWLGDLGELERFYGDPSALDSDAVVALLMRFLVHAPAHLNAAHVLVTGEPVADVFGPEVVEG